MSQRDYNHVYTCGPIVLQICQDGQHDGIAIDLTPRITLAINNGKCCIALGLDWIVGTINIGIMTKEYRQMEAQRRDKVRELAGKAGLTVRQQELKFGW